MFTKSKYLKLGKGKGNKPVFGGGLITSLESYELTDGDSPDIQNARIKGKDTTIRPGHIILGDPLAGDGVFPKGIGGYISSDGTNDHLVIAYDQSGTEKLVKVEEDGTQTPITTAALITVDERTNFTTVGGIMYVTNGTDIIGKYDGSVYSVLAGSIPALFAPAFTVLFDGAIWASGWSENPDTVYKTIKGDGDDYTGAGSDEFSNFGYNIVGLGVTMQSLFYFTNESVWVTDKNDIDTSSGVATYNQRPLLVREGSINHNSIVAAGRYLFYVTPSNKIKMITRNQEQFDSADLSHREYNGIEGKMATLDGDQIECFGYFLPFDNLVAWHFKSKGSSYNNVTIIYDLTHDCFLPDTQKFFYAGINYKNRYYTVSMLEDKVYRDEFSFTDDGTPIGFKKVSKDWVTGGPTFKQELYQTRRLLTMNRLAIVTEKIFVDGNLVQTETFNGSDLFTSEGIGVPEIGTTAIGVEGDKFGSEKEAPITKDQQVTEKSMLSVRGYRITVVWECNTLGARATLKEYDVRTEALDQLIS